MWGRAHGGEAWVGGGDEAGTDGARMRRGTVLVSAPLVAGGRSPGRTMTSALAGVPPRKGRTGVRDSSRVVGLSVPPLCLSCWAHFLPRQTSFLMLGQEVEGPPFRPRRWGLRASLL